jgi:1-acyl-sn-glycerol-3-phosphate acyltransferase
LLSKGLFPLQIGLKINYTVLDPEEPGDRPIEEIVGQVENSIKKALGQAE